VGIDTRQSWESVLAGRSGVGPITRFDASAYSTRIAGQVPPFDPDLSRMERKEARRADPFLIYANVAAAEALQDSGIDLTRIDRRRCGVIIASGIGGIKTLEEQSNILATKGPERLSPFFVPMMIGDMAAGVAGKDKDQEIICYCGAGGYASAWWFLLTQLFGYTNVKIYDGSMEAWADEGNPIVAYSWTE